MYIEVEDMVLIDDDPDVSVDREAGDIERSRGESKVN